MLEILQVHGMQLLLGYYPHGPLGGLALTLLLALSGLVLALPTALLIVLGLFAPWHCVRMAARLFVFYVRSVPLVVHLLWAYFLVPLVLGRGTPLWAMLMVVLVLFNGAYLSQAIAAAIRAFIHKIADSVERSGYRAGGPITTIALETASSNERLREECRRIYDGWQAAFADKLRAGEIPDARARRLATLIISAIEGAIILCRTQRSPQPLRDVAEEIALLVGA